ncbi:signal peptidase I [Paenibacillus sp. PAMC 26794]|uniref:signal peptidase I n=1 Tax=Paenibacillus sp. PAMC 26794 TaxID=1257080 RepID=UPI0002FEE0EB|nr:signal peptidase I [Paenibacillus sp. PAMC 26794]
MNPNNHSMEHVASEQHNEPSKPEQPGKSWVVELWDWVKTIVVAFVIMMMLNLFVFNLSMVKGQSMQPTLVERDRLFVNKIVYHLGTPSLSDVIVLRDPSEGVEKKDFLVKRIVGLPGDTIEVRDHHLYVNGEQQAETYTDIEVQDPDFGPITLEPDHFFVMGDNRHEGKSKDSRVFGSITSDQIVGKAEFIFWPFSELKKL